MSAGVLEPSAEPELDDGGSSARLAVIHWAWRLFRREWRQQLLVMALLTVAVAATVGARGWPPTRPPANPNAGTYGTASALISLPGTDPRLAADIAGSGSSTGRGRDREPGPGQRHRPGRRLRAQDPAGPYGGRCSPWSPGGTPTAPGRWR